MIDVRRDGVAMRHRFNPRGDEIAMIHCVTAVSGLGPDAEDITTEHSAMPTSDSTSRIVGHSLAISTLRTQIQYLTRFDAVGNPAVPTLLLQGETGTGKGLVARAIHDTGPRIHGPLIEVNCAAIPEALLEAELFGFEAGSFTDAKRAKPGLFEVASGGTLFLDEVNALSLLLQSKLLTAIEAKRIRRVGALVERPVDVKLIAATSTSLSEQVSTGRFRADLYHRLAVVLLVLPPLRERGEDILVLARHFLEQYAKAHVLPSKRLSEAAEAWLLRYDWPGNVRELGHLMERVTLLTAETIIAPQTLERLCLPRPGLAPQTGSTTAGCGAAPLDEPAHIRQALLQAEGNVMRAARLLGISRGALRYRMQRYGIEPQNRRDLAQLGSILSQGSIALPPQLLLRGWKRVASQTQRGVKPCWEQKPVAVLAISLTFSAAEDIEIPPDDRWTLVARWEQRIVQQLTEFGGIVLQRSPLLFIAAFGVHQALEQSPQHAVRAALEIRRSVPEMTRLGGREAGVEVRMAVHKGLVLVDVQTCNSSARVLPMADVLPLTLRLLGDAAPGEILLSPQVGRLVEGWYELQAREVLREDGLLDRTSAFEVVRLAP